MITFVFSFFNPNFNKIYWYCYRNACVWSQICCYHTSDYFDLKDNFSCSKRTLIQIESRFKGTCMSISMLLNISLYFQFPTRILSVRFLFWGGGLPWVISVTFTSRICLKLCILLEEDTTGPNEFFLFQNEWSLRCIIYAFIYPFLHLSTDHACKNFIF